MRLTHGAGVDGQAVILVLDVGTGDVDTVRLADVESIGVVATLAVTLGIVDGDVGQVDVVALDTEDLDGGVLDVQSLYGGGLELVGVDELGLGLATVGTLAVPPAGTLAVDDSAGGLGDGDALTAEADQGSLPFLVSEGGGTLEGYLEDGLALLN
jgi:hypothetical protein